MRTADFRLIQLRIPTLSLAIAGVMCLACPVATPGVQSSDADGPNLKLIGRLQTRSAKEIRASNWSIGGETLDRDFAVYANYRKYLGPLGAKSIRLQAGWAKCEKQRGLYDWTWLDEIVNDALAQGIQPWLETSYGNTIYPGGGGTGLAGGLPTSPEALQAWDNWVRALARRYRDRVHEWEIWNEPDLGKENTPDAYAALFIRTAEIIRAEQPDARIYALGLAGNLKFAESFLNRVRDEGKLSLVDAITVHGYPRNPDDTGLVDGMRAIIARLGRPIEVRQGETGAPSRWQENFALSKLPWSENTQAKWNLRRMLAHRAKDVPFNLFTISDMHYRQGGPLQMNYKGLLATNPDQTVAHQKTAYFAAQHVFAVFDDTLTRLTNFSWTCTGTNKVAASAFLFPGGKPMVALWFKDNSPGKSNATTLVGFTFKEFSFKRPVYADLLTGKVYDLPPPGNSSGSVNVPLGDWPVLVAEQGVLRLVPE